MSKDPLRDHSGEMSDVDLEAIIGSPEEPGHAPRARTAMSEGEIDAEYQASVEANDRVADEHEWSLPESSAHAWALREARLAERREYEDGQWLARANARCAECGRLLPVTTGGRPRMFCTDACKVRNHRKKTRV